MKTFSTIIATLVSLTVIAQTGEKKSVVIGSMTSKPNALLIVNPPNADQGILLPQLSTEQRIALQPSSPMENGLSVFDTNLKAYFYWSEGAWVQVFADNHEKSSFYTIDPANFTNLRTGADIRHNNLLLFETDNTFVTVSRGDLGEGIIAPVNLPHGATLQEMTVHYMDNAFQNIQVYLLRKSLTGDNESIVNWQSSGASDAIRSEIVINFNGRESIDLENYAYRVVVVFDIERNEEISEPREARQRIYGIRIKYQE